MKADYRASTDQFYKDLGILKVDHIIKLELSKLMYSINKGTVPLNVANVFNTQNHIYNTRFCSELRYQEHRQFSIMNNSFICLAPQIFSKIDPAIRECTSLNTFVKRCKNLLLYSDCLA